MENASTWVSHALTLLPLPKSCGPQIKGRHCSIPGWEEESVEVRINVTLRTLSFPWPLRWIVCWAHMLGVLGHHHLLFGLLPLSAAVNSSLVANQRGKKLCTCCVVLGPLHAWSISDPPLTHTHTNAMPKISYQIKYERKERKRINLVIRWVCPVQIITHRYQSQLGSSVVWMCQPPHTGHQRTASLETILYNTSIFPPRASTQ